jgi:DNA adenine methylase
MENAYREVSPVSPPAPYIGGKKQLSARLVALIARIPHQTYAEPFVGMGGVFFRREAAPPAEVINDRSGDVANLFRILQRHYVPLMDMLRFQLTSRADFDRLLKTDPATLTDLERAARFLYLQRCAFGGKVVGRSFGVSVGSAGRFDVTKLGPMLADISERLAGIVIENLSYDDFIRRYDSSGTLFYLDPPYFGSERDYGADAFSRADFERIAELLARIEGTFVLSINDTPEIRTKFMAFDMEEVELKYTIGAGEPVGARELIVTKKGMKVEGPKQGELL